MDISDNNLSFFRLLFDAPGVHGGWTCRKPILRSIIIRTDAKLKRNRGIQIVVYRAVVLARERPRLPCVKGAVAGGD